MKCPKCKAIHKNKEQICTKCGYKFVFNQTIAMTDEQWWNLIEKTSSPMKFFYCPEQMFSVLMTSSGTSNSTEGKSIWNFFKNWRAFRRKKTFDKNYFYTLFQRWAKIHNHKLLIQHKKLNKAPPLWKEKDIFNYGVQRILFVDDDLLVDFLIKNQFHSHEATLVVSSKGYPEYIKPKVLKILKDAPETDCFFLHGSGGSVSQMLETLHSWSCEPEKIIEIGWNRTEALEWKPLGKLSMQDWPTIPILLLPPQELLELLARSLHFKHRINQNLPNF